MSSLLLQVLPFALGAAVSPSLLTIELLILSGTTHRKSRAWMFAIGAAVTILAFGFVAATILRNLGTGETQPSPFAIDLKAVVAIALALLGMRELRPKRTAGEKHHSKVKDRLQTAKARFFLGIGVVAMLTNFSTLVLYLPAVHIIVHSDAPAEAKTAASVMLLVITILPFLLPVIAVTIVGQRSDALLDRLNVWATKHSRQINAGICFVFAVLLGYSAVKDVLG